MSLLPTFQIGLWNAWILTLFMLLHPFIVKLVDRAIGTGDMDRKMGAPLAEEAVKRTLPLPTLLLAALFIFSVFLPLLLGTPWLVLGLAIYLVGIAMFLSAIIAAARTPMGQVFSSGMYRYSRHPLYISFLFIFVGISVASGSWLFLLFSLGWMIFPLSQVDAEEQGCLESFGSEYQQYMYRTPKWLIFPPKKCVDE